METIQIQKIIFANYLPLLTSILFIFLLLTDPVTSSTLVISGLFTWCTRMIPWEWQVSKVRLIPSWTMKVCHWVTLVYNISQMSVITIIRSSRHLLVALMMLAAPFIATGNETLSDGQDSHIYKGANTYSSSILYTWDGKHLYSGSYPYSSKIILTWDGRHIYKGAYTYSSNILCTWDGKHLYRGQYAYSSDIVCTWDGEHIYSGRYTYSSDILYTYDYKHIYNGPYTYSSNILFTVDSPVPIPVIMSLLL